jgi:SAM-dependent methyltransferase
MKPQEIMEFIGTSAIVTTAIETGVLRALVEGPPSTSAALAEKLSLNPRALALTLDVLVAHGLAERRAEAYGVTTEIAALLTQGPGGPAMLDGLWRHTPRFLRTGEPFTRMDAAPTDREALYRNVVGGLGRMFAEFARAVASEVLKRIPAPRRILDVGCGSGIWSLSVAAQTPNAKVTGLDLPAVLVNFDEKAAELGLTDRTAKIAGNMHQAEIPARSFDLAIIANVLRLEQPAEAAAVVRRVAASLDEGGSLLVVDALGGGTREKEIGRTVYARSISACAPVLVACIRRTR